MAYTDAEPSIKMRAKCYGCEEAIGIIINHRRRIAVDLKSRRYGQYALLNDGVRAFDLEAEDVSERDRLLDTPRFVKHSLICDARGLRRIRGLRYGLPSPAQLRNDALRRAKLRAEQGR